MNKEIEVVPYFQPIISMSKKAVVGVEVLARGIDSQGEIYYPDRLFGGADTDAHLRIDRIVREKALSQMAKFPAHWRLFVNMLPERFLTIRDIERDSHLLATCRKFGISPERVVIEITEQATDRLPEIVPVLKDYTKLGFTVAIDDWGAEYSNFDRLAMLLPSIIKIDARFLWRATSNPSIAEIFCAAVTMAMKLGVQVIVEGVEKEEHLYMALDAGCPLAQGFLFARPARWLPDKSQYGELLDRIFFHYREGKIVHLINEKQQVRQCVEKIMEIISPCLGGEVSPDNLSATLVSLLPHHKEISNAYILNPSGTQVSPNFSCAAGVACSNWEMVGRDWSWRPYFIQSMVNQKLFGSRYTITGPYIDPNNGKSMFTVCVALEGHMLCMDLLNGMDP